MGLELRKTAKVHTSVGRSKSGRRQQQRIKTTSRFWNNTKIGQYPNLRYDAQNKGVMGKCLSRGHGRNVTQTCANVRHFTRSADGKLTRVGAEVAILLRKWCTFAIKDWL